MIFDEEFYNGGVGYPKYSNYPYFKSRAEWIKITFPDEKIIEIGCAYGYLLEHLPNNSIEFKTLITRFGNILSNLFFLSSYLLITIIPPNKFYKIYYT